MCVIYKLNKSQCIKKQFIQEYYIINFKIYCVKNEFTTGISCDIMMSVNKNTYSKTNREEMNMAKYQEAKKLVREYFDAMEKASAEGAQDVLKNICPKIIFGEVFIHSANRKVLQQRQKLSGNL